MTSVPWPSQCWLNVYLRPNGEITVGASCWPSRHLAEVRGRGLMGLKLIYRLRVRPK